MSDPRDRRRVVTAIVFGAVVGIVTGAVALGFDASISVAGALGLRAGLGRPSHCGVQFPGVGGAGSGSGFHCPPASVTRWPLPRAGPVARRRYQVDR